MNIIKAIPSYIFDITAEIPISIGNLIGQVNDIESTFEKLMIKIGVVIAMISIIAGTYVIANALYKLSSDNMQERSGTAKRIVAGSGLITFSVVIGIIIFTVYSASR